MKSNRKMISALFMIGLTLFIISNFIDQSEGEWVEKNEFVLGTFSQIRVYAPTEADGEAIIRKAFDRVHEIEKRMSPNIENSQVHQINHLANEAFTEVTEDTLEVIQTGIDYYELTDGLFHIGLGSLINIWGIGTEEPYVPKQSEIDKLLEALDINAILIENSSVMIQNKDMALDLGGIAKGYAVDESVRILKEEGIQSGFINFGGDVYALGKKPDKTPWNVGIREPIIESGGLLGRVPADNLSVVTSGDYERYFIEDDTIFHHIIDPRTGFPSESDLKSVTVISETSMDGDVYSTALFIMELSQGLSFVESVPGVEAVFVNHKKEIYLSSGLKNGGFELMNEDYTLID
ncbi:thiamine biosynthesis lipoprotein [Tindallia magadiensis]|uniref:FAD:protein FMN transferase n=1 Tax=Tindallia magadiensis TaxID=69895 RepID=A0A1I3AUI2_9FIRM|nr:FAD:protein FMN transferase [Tindallia magadiensis]SFH53673.1 thiamine biosynthesis lipoprotein [Tindallia magadiensis]